VVQWFFISTRLLVPAILEPGLYRSSRRYISSSKHAGCRLATVSGHLANVGNLC